MVLCASSVVYNACLWICGSVQQSIIIFGGYTYLYFPYHCISLIYFSFTKIRMFLYAQIYWFAEFGDVSCLQFNYLRVETLTPTWEDLVGHLSDNLVGHLSDILRVFDR